MIQGFSGRARRGHERPDRLERAVLLGHRPGEPLPSLIAAATLLVIAVFYEAVAGTTLHWITGWFVYPPLFYCGACVLSKRLHDRGRSGWWAALVLASIVAVWPQPNSFFDFFFTLVLIWAGVDLGAMPGEAGANRYGPNPLRPPVTI